MPEFHDHGARRTQEWKREVLAGEIELDEIDTEPYTLDHAAVAEVAARAWRSPARD